MNLPTAARSSQGFRDQAGVGLIEVLIAVLVLGIGLLGIAHVQTRALSGNNSSMARSMAIVASYSILDALRADRSVAIGGGYDTTVTASNCPSPSSTLASVQVAAWCTELGARLGATSTTIGIVDCTGDDCTVTVQFDDSGIGPGGETAQQVTTRAVL